MIVHFGIKINITFKRSCFSVNCREPGLHIVYTASLHRIRIPFMVCFQRWLHETAFIVQKKIYICVFMRTNICTWKYEDERTKVTTQTTFSVTRIEFIQITADTMTKLSLHLFVSITPLALWHPKKPCWILKKSHKNLNPTWEVHRNSQHRESFQFEIGFLVSIRDSTTFSDHLTRSCVLSVDTSSVLQRWAAFVSPTRWREMHLNFA